ncbi:hypothetical protein BOTBODRAFT_387101 [Botryobasidium botryosum FD-172 SS1]|uniref:Uncharacterized protein n=1 Tax=Botryobasidium botryosum (strain FD-172 SS1) TaxID=930990 RepID=A0A067MZH7_BOTB1|nr:hypothetical protein BOTBODRAFT_387101 [Botryobasidium botryosum FD-172 SS1]
MPSSELMESGSSLQDSVKKPREFSTDTPVDGDHRASLLGSTQSMELTTSTDDVAGQNLSLLRRRLNELTPFYRLPTEIISMIFLLLGDLNLNEPLLNHLAITSVSYLWRKVALQIPQLWTRICSIYPAKFLDTCLVRSGRSPLIIKSDVAAHESYSLSQFIKKVSSQMWRWHTCTLQDMGAKSSANWLSA